MKNYFLLLALVISAACSKAQRSSHSTPAEREFFKSYTIATTFTAGAIALYGFHRVNEDRRLYDGKLVWLAAASGAFAALHYYNAAIDLKKINREKSGTISMGISPTGLNLKYTF